MILQRLISRVERSSQIRCFTCSTPIRNVKPVAENLKSNDKSFIKAASSFKTSKSMNVSKLDKRILVWQKRYPNIESVPDTVKYETLQSARTKFRITCCNVAMALILIGFGTIIINGKKLRKERVPGQLTAPWHKKTQESNEEAVQHK